MNVPWPSFLGWEAIPIRLGSPKLVGLTTVEKKNNRHSVLHTGLTGSTHTH